MNATTTDSIVSRMADGRADSGEVRFGDALPLLWDSIGFEGSGDGPLVFVVEAMKELAAPFVGWRFRPTRAAVILAVPPVQEGRGREIVRRLARFYLATPSVSGTTEYIEFG
jgi:hypothetical protein